ncbi:MAG: cyanophycinase [Gemmatimonadota bacterium]|jgi:cyanophycinase
MYGRVPGVGHLAAILLAVGAVAPSPATAQVAPGTGARGADESGRLVIVGGALDDDNEAVWDAVVAGRDGEGPLCVLPTAGARPEQSMASAVSRFAEEVGEAGVEGVLVTEDRPEAADDPAVVDRIGRCSGFWFTGGDQSRIVDVFLPEGRPTAAYRTLQRRHAEGAVVAGSSAGAAMMPGRMIAGGGSEAALAHGVRGEEEGEGVWVRRGMEFHAGPIIDQHFLARGRVGRLVVATLAGEGGGIGLGIDENTALVVDGGQARVVGRSGVLLVDARRADREGAVHGGKGVVLWLLGPGDVLDLATLEHREAPGRAALAADGGSVQAPDDPFARWAFLELLAGLAASSDDRVEVPADGYRLTLRKGPAFRAVAAGEGTLEDAPDVPGGLSAGPFLLDVEPAG